MTNIGVMIGSRSDLGQCKVGAWFLEQAEREGKARLVAFLVNSIHRNTLEVLANLHRYSIELAERQKIAITLRAIRATIIGSDVDDGIIGRLIEMYEEPIVAKVDRWIIGAGMANHLTGTCDSFLRFGLKVPVPVYGAIFESASGDEELDRENRQAAILSITKVPGTKVIFDPENPTFTNACRLALEQEAPVIELALPKPTESFISIAVVKSAIELALKK
ncbi:hypothetical protein HGA64_03630 [Candidatus Falkowbacteria bacterium]|nr:hypothetical protein [Candidatus Falkowbacteria bacterium]